MGRLEQQQEGQQIIIAKETAIQVTKIRIVPSTVRRPMGKWRLSDIDQETSEL